MRKTSLNEQLNYFIIQNSNEHDGDHLHGVLNIQDTKTSLTDVEINVL